jgi:uncharacterized protein (TIGR02271 family)
MQDKPPHAADDIRAKRSVAEPEVHDREDELVIRVVAEELSVEKARVARGTVRVHKRVEAREEVVDTSLEHEDVIVERVPVNRAVEGAAPESREEDGVLVIPVLEEVAVVEKRLVLREEVRVSRRRTTTSSPQTVTLRREVVDVERVGPESAPLPDSVRGGRRTGGDE